LLTTQREFVMLLKMRDEAGEQGDARDAGAIDRFRKNPPEAMERHR